MSVLERKGISAIRRVGRWFGLALLLAYGLGGHGLRADDLPPLVRQSGAQVVEEGIRLWQNRELAERALFDGLPSLTLFFIAEARALDAMPPGVERDLDYLEISALLALGRYEEARRLIPEGGFTDAHGRLLDGLVYWGQGHEERARTQLEGIDPAALEAHLRAWWWFGRGLLAEGRKERAAAAEFYQRARAEAYSPLVEAHLLLAETRILLLGERADADYLTVLGEQIEALEGRSLAFRFVLQKVVLLQWLDRTDDALHLLRVHFPRLPQEERALREQFLLLEGMLAGSASERGREALRTLLETGVERQNLRAALQLWGEGWGEGNGSPDRPLGFLDRLIEREPPHLIRDELFARRARARLALGNREGARRDARRLLEEYPGSRARLEAWPILAIVARENGEYRLAANALEQWRQGEENPSRRAELAWLIGDSFFRSGDFRPAAEAYQQAKSNPSPRMDVMAIHFQVVQALLGAGQLDEAEAALDRMPVDRETGGAALDLSWQAEWNVARARQRQRQDDAALARVNRLLEREDAVEAALRQRFQWLRAHLAFSVGEYAETIALVGEFIPLIEQRGEIGELGADGDLLLGQSLLLLAQAHLRKGERTEGLAVLEDIRTRYPRTEAGLSALMVEARSYAEEGQTVTAASVLEDFLTRLQGSREEDGRFPAWIRDHVDLVALIYFEAALYHLRSGNDQNAREKAIARFESLVQDFPQHPLSFYARVRQGDILRQMNRFTAARQIYEQVLLAHPQHPERHNVRIALADTWFAAADEPDDRAAQNGVALLERLLDSPDLTPDLRAEAAYKLGQAWIRMGAEERTLALYYALQQELWQNETRETLGSTGRFWLARAMLERARRTAPGPEREEAREVYRQFQQSAFPRGEVSPTP